MQRPEFLPQHARTREAQRPAEGCLIAGFGLRRAKAF
jgi:hypothetical protein